MSVAAMFKSALDAHQAGRLADAARDCQQILAVDDGNADALHLLGIICQQTGNSRGAESMMRRAVALREDPLMIGNLGLLLHETGRRREAEDHYRHALRLNPDFVEANYNLANLLQESGQFSEAEDAYLNALRLRPAYPDALFNYGKLLHASERLSEAEAVYLRVLQMRPDSADAANNLGSVLRETNRPAEAEAMYRRAIQLQADYADAWSNLGQLLKETVRLDEAEAALRRALALQPDHAVAWYNLGKLLKDTGRYVDAEAAYRQSLRAKPDFADARFNLSCLLLSLGRYVEAWPLFESRHVAGGTNDGPGHPALPFPQWQGGSLAGRSLLLWPEQGVGDLIQFIRFAPLLRQLGVAKLSLVCPATLKPLLATMQGIDTILCESDAIPMHDYWAHVLSLPLRFETTLTTLPGISPYLFPLPDRIAHWRARLPAGALKVGLVWKGNPLHKNDARRSLSGVEVLAPLWQVPGVTYVSLQKGAGEGDLTRMPANMPILGLGAEINDFADTAAIVSQLDLVISVDTAVAHVAGAVGTPCWVLLPAENTDWRWMLDRADSPWYPGMRLFRQSRGSGWESVILEAAAALAPLARGRT